MHINEWQAKYRKLTKKIEQEAFYGCDFSGTAKIPSSVEYVGESAFYECKNLNIDCSNCAAAKEYCKSSGYCNTGNDVYSPNWDVIYVSESYNADPRNIDDLVSEFGVYYTEHGKDYVSYKMSIYAPNYMPLSESYFDSIQTESENVTLSKELAQITKKEKGGLFLKNYSVVDSAYDANVIVLTGIFDDSPIVNADIVVPDEFSNSIVFLDAESAIFKVTVPTVLPFTVDSDSRVSVADNAVISNKCNGQVKVTNVKAQTTEGWEIVANGTDFREVPVDSKQFTFTLNGDNFGPGKDMNLTLGNEWTVINGKEGMSLPYSGTFAVQSQPKVELPIANTIFTIAWNKAA